MATGATRVKDFFDPDPSLVVNPQPQPWELPWYGFTETQLSEDHRAGPYADYLRSHGFDPWTDPHSYSYPQHQTVRSAYPAEHHQTTWIAERSKDFIEKQDDDRPFFLWTSFVAPHHPFCVPAPYDTMYNPEDMPLPVYSEEERAQWPSAYRTKHETTEGTHEAIGMESLSDTELQKIRAYYYGSITHIDDQVGRIFQTLEKKNLLENTIVVFSTDHGEMLGDHHLLFKGTMYDEVTRMPFLVAGPGIKQEVCDGLCSAIDVMPTLLDLVGTEIPGSVQGRSLESSAAFRDEVLIEGGGVLRTLRTSTAQLTWHGPGEQGELYDLENDPHAHSNLWNSPAAAELKQELMERLMQQMVFNTDPQPVRMGR